MRCALPDDMVVDCLNKANTLSLYEEIFVSKVYDFPGLIINPGDVVVDVGANIGLFALWALQKSPNCRLFCFEPNPAAFLSLLKNVPSVKAVNAAVDRFNGVKKFTVYPRLPELSTLYPETNSEHEKRTWLAYLKRRLGLLARLARWWLFKKEVIVTRCLNLSTAVPGPIDLLKIDAEKAEHEVLNGLGDWSRVKQIIVENNFGNDGRITLWNRLTKAGFVVTERPSVTFIELECPVLFGRRP